MSQKLGLDRYLRAFPLSSGKQQLLVRPPGMSFAAVRRGLSLWNENLVVKRSILVAAAAAAATAVAEGLEGDAVVPEAAVAVGDEELPSSVVQQVSEEVPLTDRQIAAQHSSATSYYDALYPVPQFETVEVKSKALADVMEAIFGGFYVEGGLKSGVTAIKALGCWPVFDAESNYAASMRERTRHQKQHAQQLKWSVSMEIHHEVEEQVAFPEHFPEPLKRITQGVTIDLGGMAEGDSDEEEEEEGEGGVKQVRTIERTTTTTVTLTKAISAVGDGGEGNTATTIAPSVRSTYVTQAIVDSVAHAMGYTFKNWGILDEALTHCSVQYKRSNQRMEFLGDAILDFAVVSLLFKHQPWARQGDLSSQKSIATSNKNLGQFGARLQLYRYLNLSSQQLEMEFAKLDRLIAAEHTVSEEAPTERPAKKARVEGESVAPAATPAEEYIPPPEPKVIEMGSGASKALADTFEALVGAIYLDCRGEMEDLYVMVRYINLLPQLDVE
jgi:dsRNA-specific ribonuclease